MTSRRLGAEALESAAKMPGGIESVSAKVCSRVTLDGPGATVNVAPSKVLVQPCGKAPISVFEGSIAELRARHFFFFWNPRGVEKVSRVEAIGAALSVENPDPAAVQGAVMEFGSDTCFRCHLVHVPAAFAKLPTSH